jgi:demethylmenaquinone methyltransferase / 2-methoxy-6-polyprenyl-1,4-benzoquinol methylase
MADRSNNPGGENDKSVGAMFDSIAPKYDFLNHFLSFGIDSIWRKRAVRIIAGSFENPSILDVATGTGDLAIAAIKVNPLKVTGMDISPNMLSVGRSKIERMGYSGRIELIQGHSGSIPFNDGEFDIAMVAFGVRNFSDTLKGLSEMRRVIREGGMVLVLEFSRPSGFPFKTIYNLYFRNVLPLLGKIISGNGAAYRYLYDSVMGFPDNDEFLSMLQKAGFTGTSQVKLTFGVASIYTGFKKKTQ